MVSFFKFKKTSILLRNTNNKNIQVKEMSGLNHFLRTGNDEWKKTREYSLLYEIDKTALNEIINWVKNLILPKLLSTN